MQRKCRNRRGCARAGAVLLVLTLAACGQARGAQAGDPFERGSAGVLHLDVQNTLEEDVIIRVRAGNTNREIGQVRARSQARFQVPWGDFGRLTLQLEPLGGSRYSMPAVEASSGERLFLEIVRPIERSTLRR